MTFLHHLRDKCVRLETMESYMLFDIQPFGLCLIPGLQGAATDNVYM